jgi:hypothetical protein
MKPKLYLPLAVLFAFAVCVVGATGVAAQTTATVSAEEVTIPNEGETAESSITIDAPEGLRIADVTVSVDGSAAVISNVYDGEDVNSDQSSVLFEVVNRTPRSLTIQYTNIQQTGGLEGFEMGVVELESTGEGQSAEIVVDGDNFGYGNGKGYDSVEEQPATISIGEGEPAQTPEEDDDDEAGSPDGDENDDENVDSGDSSPTDGGSSTDGEGSGDETSNGGGEDTDVSGSEESDNRSTDGQNQEDGSEGNDDGNGMPGFTSVSAAIALLAAWLIAGRG